MIADILRFNARGEVEFGTLDASLTLGEYLERGGYSRQFVEHLHRPMGRALWSAEETTMLGFPARFFIEFFDRHGFLSVDNRPVWQPYAGGSPRNTCGAAAGHWSTCAWQRPIAPVRRLPHEVRVRTAAQGRVVRHVFLACHVRDQALRLLEATSAAEVETLAAFPFPATRCCCTPTRACCRAGRSRGRRGLPPAGRRARRPVALTYDMNVLAVARTRRSLPGVAESPSRIDEAPGAAQLPLRHPVYSRGGRTPRRGIAS